MEIHATRKKGMIILIKDTVQSLASITNIITCHKLVPGGV